jgi:hypothetical protein
MFGGLFVVIQVLWFFHVQAIDLNSKKARNLGEKIKQDVI